MSKTDEHRSGTILRVADVFSQSIGPDHEVGTRSALLVCFALRFVDVCLSGPKNLCRIPKSLLRFLQGIWA